MRTTLLIVTLLFLAACYTDEPEPIATVTSDGLYQVGDRFWVDQLPIAASLRELVPDATFPMANEVE